MWKLCSREFKNARYIFPTQQADVCKILDNAPLEIIRSIVCIDYYLKIEELPTGHGIALITFCQKEGENK